MDEIVTLSNKQGMSVVCSSVGAGLVDICVPDRNGTVQSVLVRPNKYSQYFRAGGHFGKPCGRTAGRISPNVFELDGKKFAIDTGNNKTFALHGGREGFSEKAFDYEKKYDKESSSIVFSYFSKDGEGGYPGNLHVKITFVLMNDENRLIIKHEASTDKPTLCNLTCHAYFNLSGNAKENILNQIMYLNSSKVGAVDCNTVAQSIVDVDKNFDFRTPHKIGDFIEEQEVQKTTLGYDHPFLLDETNEKKVQASLFDPLTGRFLEIRTSYDACVVYSSNHPSEFIIQNGEELSKYDAICLEMQHFPNSVNSNFIKDKKDILKPEQNYNNFIEYSFSTK